MTGSPGAWRSWRNHGTLLPKNPLLIDNDARLLPQTYQGTQISSSDIERDAEVAYVMQQGTFKGLGVKLRNYVYRSDFSRGRDSNRLYLTYDVALW